MPHHVLLVDDDTLVLKVLRTVLDHDEFRVTTATDGPAALEIMAADPADVVVCDVVMPRMDGYEVCRRIKSDPATAEVPVVLLTAMAGPESEAMGRRAGCDAFVNKPFRPLELLGVVRDLGKPSVDGQGR